MTRLWLALSESSIYTFIFTGTIKKEPKILSQRELLVMKKFLDQFIVCKIIQFSYYFDTVTCMTLNTQLEWLTPSRLTVNVWCKYICMYCMLPHIPLAYSYSCPAIREHLSSSKFCSLPFQPNGDPISKTRLMVQLRSKLEGLKPKSSSLVFLCNIYMN